MNRNHIFKEEDLSSLPEPLTEYTFFQEALEHAGPERQEALQQLVYIQSERFLRKCMENNHVSNEEDLSHIKNCLLGDDPDFKKALITASPKRKEILQWIQDEQRYNSQNNVALILFGVIVIIILVVGILANFDLIK